MDKKLIDQWLDDNRPRFEKLSSEIWRLAEMRFQEFQSVALLAAELEAEGFTVTKNLADIPTAFMGSYGEKGPVIAILGEFDALAGMSQRGGVAEKAPLVQGGTGHGYGHNLLGAASLAVGRAMPNSDCNDSAAWRWLAMSKIAAT